MLNNYGVQEANPIDNNATREWCAKASADGILLDWTDKRLARIVRLRLITDPGFPYWDVSYCVGETTEGKPCRVNLPFDQLPRRGMRAAIVAHAKRDKVYALDSGCEVWVYRYATMGATRIK